MTPDHPPRRCKDGAAFVETLVAVPVMALILGGIVVVDATYRAKLEAKSRARRLAWLQAESGECPARECVGAPCSAIEADIRAGGLDALLRVEDQRFTLRAILGAMGRFLLGRVTHGVGVAEASAPGLLRPGATVQRGVTTLLCNASSRRGDSGRSILEHACATELRKTEYADAICD